MLVQAGDTVDDDLRNHVWRGTVVDHVVVNLLLHVPYSRELGPAQRARGAGTALLHRGLAIARDPDRVGDGPRQLEMLAGLPIGVELDSLPDFYLGSTLGGRLRDGMVHYRRPEEALAALRAGEIAAFMGLRSQIEAGLGDEAERFDLEPVQLPGLRTYRLGRRRRGARERARSRLRGRRHPGRRRPRRHHRAHLPCPWHRLPAAALRLAP